VLKHTITYKQLSQEQKHGQQYFLDNLNREFKNMNIYLHLGSK